MDTNGQTPLSLRELQLWLRWIIVDPRGVVPALQDPTPGNPTHPDRYVEPRPSARTLIDDSTKTDLETRLGVYAEGYFSRIAEAIEGDFSTIKRLLGEDDYLKLIAEYLKDYPSKEINIGEVGQYLPEFSKKSLEFSPPYLYELLTLEWNVVKSFYAKDFPELDLKTLGEIPEDKWPHAHFRLDNSVRLLEFGWPVDELWRNREKDSFDKIKEKICSSKTYTLMFRRNGDVIVERISFSEFEVLSLLKKGLSLAEVTQSDVSEDQENRLMEWFTRWTSLGLFREIYFNKGDHHESA